MKTGIIIVFHNYEKEIDQILFKEYFKQVESIKFCLVNNNSKDNTGQLLTEVAEDCKNVSLVNIRCLKSEKSAIRAGVRYLWNEFGIEQIGFIITKELTNDRDIKSLFKELVSKEDYVLSYQSNVIEEHHPKRTLFQSLFSLVDYLDDYYLHIQKAKVI